MDINGRNEYWKITVKGGGGCSAGSGDEKSEKAEGWVRERGEKCRGKGHVGSMNET